jgi:hypothetical protein|tara:strand:+ start:367 stop:561 length:195 start_codon:yes stop_codon:yes gene_type:complete
MSELDVRIRKLEQTKKTQVSASRQQPSINEMSDGDERVVLAGGKTLRVYRKEFGKLWFMEFTGI